MSTIQASGIQASGIQASGIQASSVQASGIAAGAGAMVCVGGSVAVSGVLANAPFYTAEGARYIVACALLIGFARLTRRRLVLPRGAEWLWLCGVACTGLLAFNVALVQGSRHAEPAVLGVAVASVPSLLAVLGPLIEGTSPRARAVGAAVVVTAGAGLVQGLGRTDAVGVGYAIVVFGSECAFTLLAVPVLGRHGPVGVSVHATWLAGVMFTGIGLVREGPAAVAHLDVRDWLAAGYLAVAVTAVAFVLWYTCVGRIGASRAGLLTGVAPVAAGMTGVLLGGPAPQPLVWAGIAVVAIGLAIGLRRMESDVLRARRGDLARLSRTRTGCRLRRRDHAGCEGDGERRQVQRYRRLPAGARGRERVR